MTAARWRRIEELYHEARERRMDEREAFLAETCGADEELRRQIEVLLAQDPTGAKIMDRPAAEFLIESTVTHLTSGEHLGPYRIDAILGAGGMGEVYKARDTRLDREVAVKVLPCFATEAARARFQREARAASALNHPNICVVHDVGEASGRS